MRVRSERKGAPEQIGPFVVVRRLGAGGMAEAFEAIRRGPGGFEQRVCLKRVLPAYAADAELVRLFLREARLAAVLSHRNITRVLDFGEHEGCHYLALELVDGMDLRALMKALAPDRLPLDVAAFVAMEMAEGLHHAHTRAGSTGPVVHRDVSPANTLLSIEGDVKLTDFGISKALNDAALTCSNLVRGNIWYMAPEQLDGQRHPDPRGDLYSLGVVLYELIAGRRPYHRSNDISMMRALAEGLRVPLAEVAPHAPAALVAIVDRLLQQSPEQRYPSAAHVVEALAPHVTSAASARRDLGEIVCAHVRARTSMEEPELLTLDLTPEHVSAVDPPPLASGARPRWQRYALGPGAWQSADRAAHQRRRENRPLPKQVETLRTPEAPVDAPLPRPADSALEPPNENSEVRIPGGSSLWWVTLVLATTTALGLATGAVWAFLSG